MLRSLGAGQRLGYTAELQALFDLWEYDMRFPALPTIREGIPLCAYLVYAFLPPLMNAQTDRTCRVQRARWTASS
jgi:hypothetical protein